METAGTIIKEALTELTLQADEQTVPAVEVQTGIRYLNRMMQMLDANGVKLGYTLVNSTNDALTVPAGAYEPMVMLLAERLAGGYDFDVTPNLAKLVREARATIYKVGVSIPKQNMPSALPTGSGNDYTGDNYYDQTFFDGCCEDQDECSTDGSLPGDMP